MCKDTICNGPNNIGFACKKAQTISFIERGFERLGLSHQTVDFPWCSYIVKSCSLQEFFSRRRVGRLWFLAIFPSLCSGLLTFPFILACVSYLSSTCRIDFSKTDTCPISPYPEWLGVVVKAGEYGSVRCKVLNGSKGSFPWSLYFPAYPSLSTQIFQIFSQAVPILFFPFHPVRPRICRGQNHHRLCLKTIWTFITYLRL